MSRKKGKPADAEGEAPRAGISIATYPRAAAQVRRAKGLGGLIGFAAAALVSLQASVPLDQVGLRALACGIAGYLIAWGCSVALWRQIVLAELRALHEQRKAAADAQAKAEAEQMISAPGAPAAG